MAIYLTIKTKGSHFQKRMEGFLKTLWTLKTEYKTKVNLVQARNDLDNMTQREEEMQLRMQQVLERAGANGRLQQASERAEANARLNSI